MSAEYYYRRKLVAKDFVPAVGVAVAAGLATFYLVQLLIQRTPLVPTSKLPRELPSGAPPAGRLRTG